MIIRHRLSQRLLELLPSSVTTRDEAGDVHSGREGGVGRCLGAMVSLPQQDDTAGWVPLREMEQITIHRLVALRGKGCQLHWALRNGPPELLQSRV